MGEISAGAESWLREAAQNLYRYAEEKRQAGDTGNADHATYTAKHYEQAAEYAKEAKPFDARLGGIDTTLSNTDLDLLFQRQPGIDSFVKSILRTSVSHAPHMGAMPPSPQDIKKQQGGIALNRVEALESETRRPVAEAQAILAKEDGVFPRVQFRLALKNAEALDEERESAVKPGEATLAVRNVEFTSACDYLATHGSKADEAAETVFNDALQWADDGEFSSGPMNAIERLWTGRERQVEKHEQLWQTAVKAQRVDWMATVMDSLVDDLSGRMELFSQSTKRQAPSAKDLKILEEMLEHGVSSPDQTGSELLAKAEERARQYVERWSRQ